MRDPIIHDLFELLDIVVLRQSDNDEFYPMGSFPDWFPEVFPREIIPDSSFDPSTLSPFLENFMFDAKTLWKQNKKGRIFSGPWIETGPDGREYSLEASAISLEDTNILTLGHPKDAHDANRKILQAGRENLLTNERLEEEVRKRTLEIRDREEEVASRLLSAAEFRDDETGAHIRRMGAYSVILATKMDWSTQKIDQIRIASTMHDIGKIGIPDRILLKPGQLTEEEFEIMKEHPAIGGKMLANSKSQMINMAYDIALRHHEKWDGSGYPDGLSGTHIPVSARIVALTDVYDALIHKRVYKPAMSEAATLELMKEEKGGHFDPEIFDIFMDSLDEFRQIARHDDADTFPPIEFFS